MRYWWVNQNKTYKAEVSGGFLWSPKCNTNGARNHFYDTMGEVEAGDVIFSFCDARIKAVGLAIGHAVSALKPDFGKAGDGWAKEGWLVHAKFKELQQTIRPKDHIEQIRPYLPKKYSPLHCSGNGLQSVYLAEVPEVMARELMKIMGDDYCAALADLQGEVCGSDAACDQQEITIKGRTDIGATEKEQLVKARRGQGLFRGNVYCNEKRCRVTGVDDLQHLRASHIKPWKDSSDEEKLNGCNGLLLSPHVDHLFDKGFISFSDNGDLLVSPKLQIKILEKWGIHEPMNVGGFNSYQKIFLEYHRENVFEK